MKAVRFLLPGMLILALITSACTLLGDPPGIKTVFDIYDIPGKGDPPVFMSIDWSWQDKLTIGGLGGLNIIRFSRLLLEI